MGEAPKNQKPVPWGTDLQPNQQKRKEWVALSQTHSLNSKFCTILVQNWGAMLT
jgi:hypothetical protein